ncbi:MAG: hypothetical protein H6998_19705 [Hahellaceae bacterium]|nr:hypothetical protein [Hahellaceae bacterium]
MQEQINGGDMCYLNRLNISFFKLFVVLLLNTALLSGCIAEESPTQSKQSPPATESSVDLSTGGQGSTDTPANPSTTPSPSSPSPSTPVIKSSLTDFTFTHTADTAYHQPVTLGQPFKKGDLPAGYVVAATLESGESIAVQTDIKSKHADGSTRHAVLTFSVPPGLKNDAAKVTIKPVTASENANAPTLSAVINSGYDAEVNLQVYSLHQKSIAFGDRKVSWNVGDAITLNVNDKRYTHTAQTAGNSYKAGEAIAKSFAAQVTAGNPDVSASYQYETLTLIGSKGKSLAVSYANSGKAPIIITDQTLVSQPTDYKVSAVQALEAAASNGSEIQWLEGPLASEWIVSSNLVDSQTGVENPHLAVRFHIRAYANSNLVKTDVVVENTWSYVAEPQNYYYDVSLVSDGNVAYQQNKLLHYVHSRWKKTLWYGDQPRIEAQHNLEYLLATKQLPNYDTTIQISQTALDKLINNWTGEKTNPMHIGDATAYMPGTGAHDDIGPLPKWQALYLLSMDAGAKKVTLDSADLAGTWSVHYRNKDTGYPITLDEYPYMTVIGTPSDTYNPQTGKSEAFPKCGQVCSSPYSHDVSHQPSFAYLPYVVTGEFYYLEELQFWAVYNTFQSNPGYRDAGKGLPKSGQVRGMAWTLRTLGQAAAVTPELHPLKAYFNSQLQNTIKYFTDEYANNNEANKFGFITHGYSLVYNSGRGLAPWMDDFLTWSIGHMVELGFDAAIPFWKWKSQFPIGRMTAPGYCWVYAAPYSMNVRASSGDDFYSSFAEIYQNNVSAAVASAECSSAEMGAMIGGGLRAGEMVGYAQSPSGYPANFQPALALAAETGLPNAQKAWQIFADRPVKPDYSAYPNWAIVPRETADSGTPDTGSPDTGNPDNGTPDSGEPDTDTPDSGSPDSGSPDPTTPGSGTPTETYDIQSYLGQRVTAHLGEVVGLAINNSTISTKNVYWNVVEQPSQSQVFIGNSYANKTTFKADVVGSYRINATIGDARGAQLGWIIVDYIQKPPIGKIVLADNTAISLGDYDCQGKGPEGEGVTRCRTISDYSGMVEDPVTGNMLMFGGGHAATARTDIDSFSFDTLTWNSLYPTTPCEDMTIDNFDPVTMSWKTTGHPIARHTYDLLGATKHPHEFLIFHGWGNVASGTKCSGFNAKAENRVAHYSFETKKWSYGDIGLWSKYAASEYDPVSGLFIFVGNSGIHAYDPVNRKQRTIKTGYYVHLSYAQNLVYFPPNDRFYYLLGGASAKAYEVTLDRENWENSTIELVDVTGTPPTLSETGWGYDSANSVIGGAITKGVFHVFDPIAKSWNSHQILKDENSPNIGTQAFHAIEYSERENVYVFKTGPSSQHQVWMYRYKN